MSAIPPIEKTLIEKLEAEKFKAPDNVHEHRDNAVWNQAIAIVREHAAAQGDWQPLETAPKGYDGVKFNHVLFRGVSKARSFSGPFYVSGWMDNDRKPVHEYAYKLIITGWKPLSVIEGEAT
ncbi:MAG: hypothetical protein JWN86_353 [Planctomycetota bacterium]|nr:hypothetical protein [Planctomycetota bacterium]